MNTSVEVNTGQQGYLKIQSKYPLNSSKLLASGKTKDVYPVFGHPNLAIFCAKDAITAGDGARKDEIEGKAEIATHTTCNVFRLLKECGVPVAFVIQDSPTSFVGEYCQMFPYEVVVRRQAYGSYLKRHPSTPKGQRFEPLLVEFFLKTKDRRWKTHVLPCDDPYMMLMDNSIVALYNPSETFDEGNPFLVLSPQEVFLTQYEHMHMKDMSRIACEAFAVLERAWRHHDGVLVDFKVEFGITQAGIRLADVIDNDSWRVLRAGAHLDKQVYREGGDLQTVAGLYAEVADITGKLTVEDVLRD